MIKKGSIMIPDAEPELLDKNPDYYSLIKKNVTVTASSPAPPPGLASGPGPAPSPSDKILD